MYLLSFLFMRERKHLVSQSVDYWIGRDIGPVEICPEEIGLDQI
jgi:hypothetical protein